jgi:uncharacterized protein (DUF58 family)
VKAVTVHKSGLVYCLVVIVVSLVAVYGGNNFHYLVAAVAMGYFAVSGIAGYRNIRGVEATLEFPDEIYAGSKFLVKVSVRCKMRSPAFLINVTTGPSRAFFHVVQPGETVSKTLELNLPSRGICEIKGIELSSSYPFDFFTRYRPVKYDGRVIVFPEPLRSRCDDTGYWAERGELGTYNKLDAERDTIGVRPYVEGDPMRTIHWKSSAKSGRINSRLYDDSTDSEARVIDLDSLVLRGCETGLSIASYELSRAIITGRPIGMVSGGRLWPPSESRSDKLSLLSVLALYE